MPSPTSDSAGATRTGIVAALRQFARTRPGAIAIDGERRLSWRVLREEVERCAAEVQHLPTPVVAWQLDDDWRWVVLDLACVMAGKIALPLPRFFTGTQTARALEAAGCPLLLVSATGGRRRAPGIGRLGLAAVGTGARADAAPIPDGTAKITFTSGSTGEPKGVCLSQAQLERVAAALNERLGPIADEAHLCALPLAVLLENVGGLYRCLLAGSRYIVPGPEHRALTGSSTFHVGRLAAAVTAHAARLVITTPLMLEHMADSAHCTSFARLRFVAVGGAPLPVHTLAAARAAGIPAFEGYGLSECGSVVALNVPGDDRPGSVGRPLPHLSVALQGDEIMVAGASFLGYLGEPGHSPERVATGDIGRLADDGRLAIAGRLSNRIVTPMGRNIAPEWIEAELARFLPGHSACVVDDRAGLTAIVAAANDQHRAVGTALARTNQALPDYAQIRHWVAAGEPFTAGNDCLTANGRLRRTAIRDRFARHARVPVHTAGPATRDHDLQTWDTTFARYSVIEG